MIPSVVQTSFDDNYSCEQITPLSLDSPLVSKFSVADVLDCTAQTIDYEAAGIVHSNTIPGNTASDDDESFSLSIENLLPDDFASIHPVDTHTELDAFSVTEGDRTVAPSIANIDGCSNHYSGEMQKRRKVDSRKNCNTLSGCRFNERTPKNQTVSLSGQPDILPCTENCAGDPKGAPNNNQPSTNNAENNSLGRIPESVPTRKTKGSGISGLSDKNDVFKIPRPPTRRKRFRDGMTVTSPTLKNYSKDELVRLNDEVLVSRDVDEISVLLPPPPPDEFFKTAGIQEAFEKKSGSTPNASEWNYGGCMNSDQRGKQNLQRKLPPPTILTSDCPIPSVFSLQLDADHLNCSRNLNITSHRDNLGHLLHATTLITQANSAETLRSKGLELDPHARVEVDNNRKVKENSAPDNNAGISDHTEDSSHEYPCNLPFNQELNWDPRESGEDEQLVPNISDLSLPASNTYEGRTPSNGDSQWSGQNASQFEREQHPEQIPSSEGLESVIGKRQLDYDGPMHKKKRTRVEDLDPSDVYVCSFDNCRKKFAKKYNLKIHERRHRGDLPFLCPHCAKKFMWQSSFERHLRVHEARAEASVRRMERGKYDESCGQKDRGSKFELVRTSETTWKLQLNGLSTLVTQSDPGSLVLAMSLCTMNCIDEKEIWDAFSVEEPGQFEEQHHPAKKGTPIEVEQNGVDVKIEHGIDFMNERDILSNAFSVDYGVSHFDALSPKEMKSGGAELVISDPCELE